MAATPAAAAPRVAMSAVAAASARAAATGNPVAVDADTTAYTDTVANPDGSFTTTYNELPQHARRGGAWTTPDATLKVNADGSVSPAAAVSGLVLSGGGDGPFAVLDDAQGHRLAVRLPFVLPRPTLAGPTATYQGVLPGVDLVVTATVDGGFREVLVVHDEQAAANRALASVTMTAAADGLNVTTDPASGAVTAADPRTGLPVFSAPPPLMWDSATPTAAEGAMLDAHEKADPWEARPRSSSPALPGVAAHVSAIPVSATAGALTLRPALSGSAVRYPLYIDPGFNATTSPENYVQSFHTSSVEYNPTDNLRTGLGDWTTNCGSPCYKPGITRSFLWYNIASLLPKYVTEAHLQVNELSASCSGSYALRVSTTSAWITTPGASNLTWDNQTASSGTNTTTKTVTGTTGGYQVPLTTIIKTAQTSNWSGLGLIMKMDTETDHCAFRHWALNPQIVATYWSKPNTPTSLTQINGTASYTCNTTSPGTWIPALTGNQLTVGATMSTPDNDTDFTARFSVSTNGSGYVNTDKTAHQTGSTAVTVTNPLTINDGAQYAWNATALNAYLASDPSATCYFRYDATPPSAPVPSSTAYPAAGPTTVAAGGSGTVVFGGADSGTNPSGVAGYNYNVNGTSLTSGGGGEQFTTASSVSVPLSSLHWGTNTVWAQTKDNAGNLSQPSHYDFYVQQSAFGAYTPGTSGDLDGDNNPDLVTVDAAGNLRLFTHPDTVTVNPTGNTGTDPLQYGGRILVPHTQDSVWPGGTFAGALVAHAGSFIGQNTDDLIIEQNGNLAIAENTAGNGTSWTQVLVSKPACGSCANYNGLDWSGVLQMVAAPTTAAGRPDLLTVEYQNGTASLWRYPHSSTGAGFDAPTLISPYTSGWHWDSVTLIGAGPLRGTTGTSLWTRETTNGKLSVLHNVEAGLPDPASTAVTLASSGYDGTTYPLIASVGRADANGNLPLWTAGATGALGVRLTTTSTSGVTTLAGSQTLSATGWSGHEVALQGTYRPYNNMGIAYDDIEEAGFDTPGAPGNSYSTAALANATLGAGVLSGCPPAQTTTCATGTSAGGLVQVPQTLGTYTFTMPFPWAHRLDNYATAGQVIAAPINPNGSPSAYISFLGSATTAPAAGVSGTATVTYTDGHTQLISITLSDWTLDNDTYTPAAGNVTALTTAYRNDNTTGTQNPHRAYLYATAEAQLLDNGQPLTSGVQIASITLPVNSQMHIFSVAVS